jgi:hypothetical protein
MMCHYRSYIFEDKAKAEADRQKEMTAKRSEVVGSLLREANKPERTSVQPSTVKEPAPAR